LKTKVFKEMIMKNREKCLGCPEELTDKSKRYYEEHWKLVEETEGLDKSFEDTMDYLKDDIEDRLEYGENLPND
jgi:hypothetical protein